MISPENEGHFIKDAGTIVQIMAYTACPLSAFEWLKTARTCNELQRTPHNRDKSRHLSFTTRNLTEYLTSKWFPGTRTWLISPFTSSPVLVV